MATALAVTSSYAQNDVTSATQIVRGSMTLSGNYGTGSSHGDTVSFANIYGIQSQSIPLRVFIYEAPPSGTAPSFYEANYCPGTTNANGVVNFSLAGTEYSEGTAYSGALASAVWKFEAVFPAFV
jgi:hypothetical protein